MEIFGQGLRTYGGDKCVETVKTSMDDFHALVAGTAENSETILKGLFNPCNPLLTDLDRSQIEAQVMGNFQGITQYNDFEKFNLKNVCDIFVVDDGNKPIEKLAKFNSRTWPNLPADQRCTWSNYDGLVDYIKAMETTFDDSTYYRQWFYQTCSAFRFAQTAATGSSPFAGLKYVNVENI